MMRPASALALLLLLSGWVYPTEPQQILAAHGVVLDGAFPPRVRKALASGLLALPPALRNPPDGPLVLHWDPEPRPYAQRQDPNHFVVHAFAPASSPRATFRLEALTPQERAELWWRRAMVHAIVARWDRARGWSESARWRKVALWKAAGLVGNPTRRGTDPWSVSRPAGARSPHLDLVTFAEEAFVPATSVHTNAVTADASVRCQERSKWRFLFETLAAENLARYRQHGACPAFDAWADLAHLEAIEVLFVAASASAPESAFGHLMLRPVYGLGARISSPGFQTVIQIVALTSKAGGALSYMWRGMTGEFPMVVMTTTLASIRREKLELEQRDIHRFRLRLSGRERARLMDRVWDLERVGSFPYHFFSQNCATILVWLVDGALDAGVSLALPDAPWVMPGAVLDVLAAIEVTRPENQPAPLLAPVAGTLTSTATRARRAHRRREALVARLPDSLVAIHRASLDPDPHVRRRAYERLPRAIAQAGAPTVAYAWLALTARIERYLADRAVARQRAKKSAEGERKDRDPDARLKSRRTWLRGDPSRTRRLSALVWQTPADHVEPTAAEQTFYRFTAIWSTLIERHWREADPRLWLETQTLRDRQTESAWSRRAIPRSGAGRHVVGFGVDRHGPGLVIGSAGLGTRLGEPLRHGNGPETEVRIFEGRMWIRQGESWPEIARSELTFIGLRSIGRDIPSARGGFLDRFGWGAQVRWDQRDDRPLGYRLSIDGELLWVLDSNHRAAAHNLMGLGISAQARWSDTTVTPAIAPTLSLVHRTPLGGSLENAFRMAARWAPAITFDGNTATFALAQEGAATLALDFLVGEIAGQVIVVGPTLMIDWLPERELPLSASTLLRLGLL